MDNNLLTAHVTLQGTRPLLWHHFGPEAIPADGRKGERTGAAGNDPEEWRRTMLVTPEGQLYLEPAYAYAAIREGARYVKKGRGSLQSAVAATVQILDEIILVDRWLPGFPNGHPLELRTVEPPPLDATLPVYLDVRGVRNPATKARNVRYRVATAPGWQVAFSIQWDKTVIARDQMKAVLLDAGNLVGLGNGRNIGLGRFNVLTFEIGENGSE
jgi:hypothetical protein